MHIQGTDAQIDALVYELYGLTEEEVEVVEATDGSGQSGDLARVSIR